jgi:hypothetical protein
MLTKIAAFFARLVTVSWPFPRAVFILLSILAFCSSPPLRSQTLWQFHIDGPEPVTVGTVQEYCVASSHDGGFAVVMDYRADVCNKGSFESYFANNGQSLLVPCVGEKPDTLPDILRLKIPCALKIPGVLRMYDTGDGHIYFTADGVNDLIAVHLYSSNQTPIFLHTGIEATDLAVRNGTLWIAGSKGITTLNLSKWDVASLEGGLQQSPVVQGVFGEWNTFRADTSAAGATPNLTVRDAVTGEFLVPTGSPASFSVTGSKNPVTPQKITVKYPWAEGGKKNPLTFLVHSWCDPANTKTTPCKTVPATDSQTNNPPTDLTAWTVTSPAGDQSCHLGNAKTDAKTGEITRTATLSADCTLQVTANAALDKQTKKYKTVKIGIKTVTKENANVELSFCALADGESSCH